MLRNDTKLSVERSGLLADAPPPLIMPTFFGYRYAVVDTACVFKEHIHQDYEVIFVDVGQYRCMLNGVYLELQPDDLLVVKPNDRHEDSFAPPLRCIAIGFRLLHPSKPDLKLSLFADMIRPEQQVAVMAREEIFLLIARMREEEYSVHPVSPMIRDALLREFFWRMVKAFGQEAISSSFLRSSDDQSWQLKLSQLMRMYREVFPSVAEMARAVGVSERTLTNRCHHILNESPSRALMNYKLDEALAMVNQTEMTMQQISHALGFSNPYHFSQAFKRRFGASPLNLRQQK